MSNYTFTLSDGTTLGSVGSLFNNGPSSQSMPIRVHAVEFADSLLPGSPDSFMITGDVRQQFTQGVAFTVVGNSGYDGSYTAECSGFAVGDLVCYYDGTHTHVPVAAGITTTGTFNVVGVTNNSLIVEGVANGPQVFLPTSLITLSGNTNAPSNQTYTVTSAISPAQLQVVSAASAQNTITVAGSVARFFTTLTKFKVFGSSTFLDGEYRVLSSMLTGGNTVITIDQTFAPIPSGAQPSATSVASLSTPKTEVVVGTLPVNTNVTGTVTPAPPTSLAHEQSPTATVNGNSTIISWFVPGNHTQRLIPGTLFLVRDITWGSGTATKTFTVASTSFTAASANHPQGFTTVVTNIPGSVAPSLTATSASRIVYPVPPVPYGSVRIASSLSLSPLGLVGKGSQQYNQSKSWGEILQENLIHEVENFANDNPPIAPLLGQMWYSTNERTLRAFVGAPYNVIDKSIGDNSIEITLGSRPAPTAGEVLWWYNESSVIPSRYTVVSATSGSTSTVVLAEPIASTSFVTGSATAPYGQLIFMSDFKGVISVDVPALGNVNMGDHRVTNTADPVDPKDSVNLQFAEQQYVNVTGDTMTGPLFVNAAATVQDDFTVTDGSVLIDSGNLALIGGDVQVDTGNVTLSGGDIQVDVGTVKIGTGATSITVDDSSINIQTPTTGNAAINVGGNRIINVSTPTSTLDAANKAYVDGLTNGIVWISPVVDPNLFSDALSSPPTVPANDVLITYHRTYIVGAGGSGAWAGLSGHAVAYNGTSWISVLGRPVAVGDRFGVYIGPNNDEVFATLPAGGLTGHAGQIATITSVSPLAYTFYTPTEPDAVSVIGNQTGSSLHFGHSYTFRGTWSVGSYGTGHRWIEFAGPQMLADGAGIYYQGNVLNVGAGAGVLVGSDSVSLDVSYTDLRYPQLSTANTLAGTLTLNGSTTLNDTLTVSANGTDDNVIVTDTSIELTGTPGTSTGTPIILTGGASSGSTGGNVIISGGAGSTTADDGTVELVSGIGSIKVLPTGGVNVGGAAPTAANQAIVSNRTLFGTASPEWQLVATKVATAPASSAAAGVSGDWFADDAFFYVYGATGWRRLAISTF